MIEFDSKICHVTFSHSDCKDLWPAYFGEMSRYFKTNLKHYLCVDKIIPEIPSHITPLVYDQSLPYPKRLISCLNQLTEFDTIFFDHEDMFLYDEPNFELLRSYYELIKNKQLDHIRLIKGGLHFYRRISDVDHLYRILRFSRWIFSIQPSFWNKDVFLKVLLANQNCNIWDLERLSQSVMRKLKVKTAYSHVQGSKRRGYFHFDNKVYPYIATAIGKGKWNLTEYREELSRVFERYNINPSIRGWS